VLQKNLMPKVSLANPPLKLTHLRLKPSARPWLNACVQACSHFWLTFVLA
jgi:hypothetical protein